MKTVMMMIMIITVMIVLVVVVKMMIVVIVNVKFISFKILSDIRYEVLGVKKIKSSNSPPPSQTYASSWKIHHPANSNMPCSTTASWSAVYTQRPASVINTELSKQLLHPPVITNIHPLLSQRPAPILQLPSVSEMAYPGPPLFPTYIPITFSQPPPPFPKHSSWLSILLIMPGVVHINHPLHVHARYTTISVRVPLRNNPDEIDDRDDSESNENKN
jgi:hypothetical protein